MANWFPKWQAYQGKIDHRPVASYEYLPPLQSALLGVQHAFAMFGATVLAPLLMGFSPNLAILMSGVCTILFFLLTGGRVPSYLGSSFAFIAVVAAATGHMTGSGVNPNLAVALGGIVACGVVYALIGFAVILTGTRWIEAHDQDAGECGKVSRAIRDNVSGSVQQCRHLDGTGRKAGAGSQPNPPAHPRSVAAVD